MPLITRSIQRTFSTSFKDLLHQIVPHPAVKVQSKLVILGSGWSGYKLIKGIDKTGYDVHLVSPSVGTLELRSAIEPVRSTSDVTFYEASCTSIDFDRKTITCQNIQNKENFEVSYDQLIISCGAKTNTFNIPGVNEYASFLKDITHARNIRRRLIHNLELASQPTTSPEDKTRLLHFAVVGGGPTGVEFCAELYDLVVDDISRTYPHLKNYIKISLYDVAPRILPSFNEKLSNYATEMFTKRGISINTKQGVKEVKETEFVLNDGTEIPYGLLMWSTGLAPNELISGLDIPKDRMKRVFTDEYLRVLDKNERPVEGVYAIGDCATIKTNDLPCTAQVAKQKAEYLMKTLNRVAKSDFRLDPFQYHHRGSMAYVGGWKAVVDMEKSQQVGTTGWLIWRGAYFSMAESLRNKIKIPTYWVLTWLLGREISKF